MSIPMYNSVVQGNPWSYTKCSLTPFLLPKASWLLSGSRLTARMLTAL